MPIEIMTLADDCYKEYKDGSLGDGEYMASGATVSEEFINRCKSEGYDIKKFDIPEIAEEIECNVDDNNDHLMSKYRDMEGEQQKEEEE
jgi:hypothetical protein|tara:strand:+ start:765 stop:1031 length:267 start_codon:yes stop_codon:yes gene_type:complete